MALSTDPGIKLSQVITEIGLPTASGLAACFTNATGTFNPTYEGSKDRLSNFRGYEHADTEAPTVPTALWADQICQTEFTLHWTASTDNVGVDGYKVFKNGGLYQDVGNTTTKGIVNQTAGASNNWTVSAYDVADNESAESSQLNVTQSETVTSFTQSGEGQVNGGLACGEAIDVTRYLTGGDSTPTNGDVVYTDACATTVMNGGSLYYSDGSWSYQIASNGTIFNRQICGA